MFFFYFCNIFLFLFFFCLALFFSEHADDLSLTSGEIVYLVEKIDREWYRGRCKGNIGIFPVNHVQILVCDSVLLGVWQNVHIMVPYNLKTVHSNNMASIVIYGALLLPTYASSVIHMKNSWNEQLHIIGRIIHYCVGRHKCQTGKSNKALFWMLFPSFFSGIPYGIS